MAKKEGMQCTSPFMERAISYQTTLPKCIPRMHGTQCISDIRFTVLQASYCVGHHLERKKSFGNIWSHKWAWKNSVFYPVSTLNGREGTLNLVRIRGIGKIALREVSLPLRISQLPLPPLFSEVGLKHLSHGRRWHLNFTEKRTEDGVTDPQQGD